MVDATEIGTSRRGNLRALYAGIAVVFVLALAGGIFAVQILKRGSTVDAQTAARATVPAGSDLGRPFRTSFGSVTALELEPLSGLTAKSLAGVTHGIQNLVPAGKMQLQFSVQVRNTLNHAVRYTPAQFSVRVGRNGREYPVQSASFRPGTLPSGAQIEGTLSVVAKASKTKPILLEFSDPARPKPIEIKIGTAREFAKIRTSVDPNYGAHLHHHNH